MLPIDNQHYGILYSFQPKYLAHLIADDNGRLNSQEDNEAVPAKNVWASLYSYVYALIH